MFEFAGEILFITDLNSKAGTYVGGERIGNRVQLQDGTPVRIGTLETVIRFL
jgi:pSer/pThr/pTyr-binding forkhead associated (FHA) protein